jgi:hypothetical protein
MNLQSFILSPKIISSRRFKLLCKFENAIPNPYDDFELKNIIGQITIDKFGDSK